MRVRPVIATALLFGSAAWAQSDTTQYVFQLSNSDSLRAREIATAVQSLLAPRTVADTKGTSLTIDTAPADVALGQWLIEILDKPVETGEFRVDRYPGASSVAVFRLGRPEPAQIFSEMLNAARTVPEIIEMYPVSRANAIVARADQDRLDKAEWILRQLDVPTTQGRSEAIYHATAARDLERRVFYTREALPVAAFQEILNVLRVIPPLTKVFPVTSRGAVAVAGEPEQIALAEWLFQQLDRPAPDPSLGSPSHEAPSGDTAQVFFMRGSLTEDSFRDVVNRVRAATQSNRVFPCTATRAVVVRGTSVQLNQAAEIVKVAAQQ